MSTRNSWSGTAPASYWNVPSVQIVEWGTTVYGAYRYATNQGTYSYGPYMTGDTSRTPTIYPTYTVVSGGKDYRNYWNMTVTVTYKSNN